MVANRYNSGAEIFKQIRRSAVRHAKVFEKIGNEAGTWAKPFPRAALKQQSGSSVTKVTKIIKKSAGHSSNNNKASAISLLPTTTKTTKVISSAPPLKKRAPNFRLVKSQVSGSPQRDQEEVHLLLAQVAPAAIEQWKTRFEDLCASLSGAPVSHYISELGYDEDSALMSVYAKCDGMILANMVKNRLENKAVMGNILTCQVM